LEQGGLVFAYLGPEQPPLLPAYEFLTVPDESRRAAKYLVECNYLQGVEGGVDPVQLTMFRRLFLGEEQPAFGSAESRLAVESELTEFGVRLFALQPAGGDSLGLEIRDFVLPAVSTLSGVGIDGYSVHWYVPIDDTHHWRYVLAFQRSGPISDAQARRNGVEHVEGYRLTADLTDRASGDQSFVAFAVSLAESQGSTFDRTQEHLVETDAGLLAMRAVVHRAIQDVQEGADPPHIVRDEAANSLVPVEARETSLAGASDWRSQLTQLGLKATSGD
jgi:hypothetical protein